MNHPFSAECPGQPAAVSKRSAPRREVETLCARQTRQDGILGDFWGNPSYRSMMVAGRSMGVLDLEGRRSRSLASLHPDWTLHNSRAISPEEYSRKGGS